MKGRGTPVCYQPGSAEAFPKWPCVSAAGGVISSDIALPNIHYPSTDHCLCLQQIIRFVCDTLLSKLPTCPSGVRVITSILDWLRIRCHFSSPNALENSRLQHLPSTTGQLHLQNSAKPSQRHRGAEVCNDNDPLEVREMDS